jgi:15-cis-phytoene desaturase
MRTVAIIGGGLGGLSCAKSLVDAGFAVSVYEAQSHLGGRASTYRDGDGTWIEQGLHLFFGTYSELRKLLEEVGQSPSDILFWMDQVRLRDPVDGARATFGINPLTSPLKTLLGLLVQNRYLGPLDKASILPIAARGLLGMETLRARFDHKTVADLWKESGGTDDVMERYLRPFCRAIQFTDAEEFSAYNFLGWIHDAAYALPHVHLGGYDGAREETMFRPLARYLEARRATIRKNARLREIHYDAASNSIKFLTLESGARVEADDYVMALPAWEFAPLIPEPLRTNPFFAQILTLPVAPAISVQLWFDRPVVDTQDFTLVARSFMPVYQEQGRSYGDAEGTRISATISPADGYMAWGEEGLVAYALNLLAKIEPKVKGAKLVKRVILKHEKHLVRPRPGAMSRRPTQRTPVSNLFLAGDWTQQDYFGSQEGAVRGGRACAREILAQLELEHKGWSASALGAPGRDRGEQGALW